MAYKSVKSFATAFQKYVTKDIRAAGVTGINRSIASTRTQAVRQVADATGGKQKDLRVRLGVFKASAARPKGAFITFAKPVSLSAFNPKTRTVNTTRGRRTGVTVTGPQGRYLVPAASLARYKSGKTSVFTRLSGGQVKNLYTNQVIRYMSQSNVMRGLQDKASREFEKNFLYEVRRRGITL